MLRYERPYKERPGRSRFPDMAFTRKDSLMSEMTQERCWVGIDWGDAEHRVHVLDGPAKGRSRKVKNSAEGLADLTVWLRRLPRLGGICVETKHGPLIAALLLDGLPVYPVNPKLAANWRRGWSVADRKDDAFDAWVLAGGLRTHHVRMKPLRPDDPATRKLAILCQDESSLIRRRAGLLCALKSALKTYFPAALEWFADLSRPVALDFLIRFPTARALADAPDKQVFGFFKLHRAGLPPARQEQIRQRARALDWPADPVFGEAKSRLALSLVREIRLLSSEMAEYRKEIERLFNQHPDAPIFRSLPRAAEKLAPRLLSHFGADRSRYQSSAPLELLSGCAPVTRQSGRKQTVLFRWACQKSFRNTMFQFAFQSIHQSVWAHRYYEQARASGQSQPQALRNLGQKWIRIIYRMWQTRTPYNEARHLESLARHGSPLARGLVATCA